MLKCGGLDDNSRFEPTKSQAEKSYVIIPPHQVLKFLELTCHSTIVWHLSSDRGIRNRPDSGGHFRPDGIRCLRSSEFLNKSKAFRSERFPLTNFMTIVNSRSASSLGRKLQRKQQITGDSSYERRRLCVTCRDQPFPIPNFVLKYPLSYFLYYAFFERGSSPVEGTERTKMFWFHSRFPKICTLKDFTAETLQYAYIR